MWNPDPVDYGSIPQVSLFCHHNGRLSCQSVDHRNRHFPKYTDSAAIGKIPDAGLMVKTEMKKEYFHEI